MPMVIYSIKNNTHTLVLGGSGCRLKAYVQVQGGEGWAVGQVEGWKLRNLSRSTLLMTPQEDCVSLMFLIKGRTFSRHSNLTSPYSITILKVAKT